MEPGSREDTAGPWQRWTAEFVGALLLTLAAIGPVVAGAVLGRSVGDAAAVPAGLTVMALILAIGELSGAHLNPAVTIAFAARGDFPWARVPAYLSAQFTGAIVAALFLRALFGPAGDLGVPIPAPAVGAVRTWTLEIVLTAGLVTVILGTASRARNVGGLSAIGIGGYIVLAGLWAGPLGAGSMNPARSLGSALVAGRLDDVWIYLVGPLAGALVAVVLAYILRGPGGDDEARESAQGAAG